MAEKSTALEDLVLRQSRSIEDLGVPGVAVELSPDEADAMGAFVEDGISQDDAFASALDGADQ